MQTGNRKLASIAVVLFLAAGTAQAEDVYAQTNFISTIEGHAELIDLNLQGA